MKHLLTALAALVCAVVLASWAMAAEAAQSQPVDVETSPVQTQPAEEDAAEEDDPLPPAYAFFARELEMSARQVGQLRLAIRQSVEALTAWEKENVDTVKGMQHELVEAHRAGDRETAAALQKRLAVLQKERRDILTAHERTFQAILSPKQKQQYAVLQVTADALESYRELKLNDRQIDVIKTLAGKAHEQIEKAGDDKAAIEAAHEQLHKEIETRVLTPEQLQALKAKPATQPVKK
ncbi:MAG: hypothetical protein FWE88_03755 [Phycisphaerae bacterium]|nr:hypothetical protein [Phycisphaerae bacterium]